MTEQYWIGDFFVDLTRNQITRKRHSHPVRPKALAVLTFLAENQGKVVSQEALLANVWEGTVVAPNTLQRSIAQLRKALGDDGKGRVYIETHARRGYSLECDVRWHDNVDNPEASNTRDNPAHETDISQADRVLDSSEIQGPSMPSLTWGFMVIGTLVLMFSVYKYFTPKQSSSLAVDNIRTLTATDDKEFDATYTPDGKYIVFHRYLDNQCGNKLWAKNLVTQKETQLTNDWASYRSHSFSEDGKRLVFLKSEACSKPVEQTTCYDLVSLDFEDALESPQDPKLVLQCKNSEVKNPTWLNKDSIAILQKKTDRWALISYSVSENKSIDLYNLKDGNLIDFAYSAKDELIAVISTHADEHQYIDMLKPDGRLISSHPIERPRTIPRFSSIYPTFGPLNKQLIFSTGRQLFTLSYDGKVSKVSVPFAERMVRPEFHPDGTRLLMIKGSYDSDIALLPLTDIAENNPLTQTGSAQSKQRQTYTQTRNSFERSNLGEDYAKFQPGGELIAFSSERSGGEQLWVSDGNGDAGGQGPRQLTQFTADSTIRGIDWAADGNSLLVNANNVLTQVFLDSSQKSFPLKHPVIKLFQWDSKSNSALLLTRIKGLLKFVETDLNNSEIREIVGKNILWALKSEDGRLIYKDDMGQFWQPGPAEPQLITTISKQGPLSLSKRRARAKTFVIKDNVIYAINSENQLWSYDLNSDAFNILGELDEDVDHLTDISQTQLLMTVRVAAKKEVVELNLP